MARHLRAAVDHVKCSVRSQFSDVDALAEQVGHEWRDRLLTPAVTVWLFALQILNGNVAITALRHLGGIATAASSYCEARKRLPLELFARLFDLVSQKAGAMIDTSSTLLLQGRRVLLGDATTFSMPDTPELRQHFGYPPGQRDGLGFPVGKLLGVIDALSGCVLMAMGCPLFTHETRHMLTLHPLLKRGDVLVADRGFCSYAQIALLLERGVDVVLRLHQRRPTGSGKDRMELWEKPKQRPEWMSEELWKSLPLTLRVRIVHYTVDRKNSRTRHVYVVTTLLNTITYPPATIQQLYGHRWNIETCFNQLKTSAKMNTLKSTSLEGVIKELIMYLIVWNLVRMTMAMFAQRHGVSAWRVSFIDTMRWLGVLLQSPRPLEVNVLLLNPDRPDRWEPRKLKRRIKEYDLLNEPRRVLKAKHRARYA